MIRIEMNPNDQKDIIELLYYSLGKKLEEEDKGKWNNKNYWRIRIEQLLQIMGGKNVSPAVVRSSMPHPIKRGKRDLEMEITMLFGGRKPLTIKEKDEKNKM